MCGLRKSLPCQFSFSSRHREIVGTYYWLLCGCFGVLFDELHAFHAHFNLRSRQFLDCFSFGICKVRDTAGRKLKRVQMILNEWCLGTALAWLGLNLKTNQKKRSATQATQTAISHLHRSMIYLTFMMNIILFRTALTLSVSWVITLSFTDVHILRRQLV